MKEKNTLEQDKKELENKAKVAAEKIFINLDLSNFPLMYDIISNAEVKKEVNEWITKIVWYILKRDGEIFTLTVREYDLIESLKEKENVNYNKLCNKLHESFNKNKGKSIKEYVYYKEYYNTEQFDENFIDEEDDYKKHSQYDKTLILDGRIDVIIDKLQILLFGENGRKGFFEIFYDEYGEICNAQEEFINFCKKTIRENIFVFRYSQNQNNSNKKIISFEVKEVFNEYSKKTIVKCIKKDKKDIESENLILKDRIIRIRRDSNIIFENINSIAIIKINDDEYDIEIDANPEIQKKDIIEIVETSNMKIYTGRKSYSQEDEENKNYEKNYDKNYEKNYDKMEEIKQKHNHMNNKLINFLLENSEEVNDIILKELLQDNSLSKTKEIKKVLIVFYLEYTNLIETDCIKSPDDMRIFNLLKNYFGETEIKQLECEIQNSSIKEKKIWLENQLDSLSFWQSFYNMYEQDIKNIDYNKELKLIKSKNESRIKEDIIGKMKDIIVSYSIANDILIKKEEIEIILTLLRRMLLKTGGNLTKLEINEVANKIKTYKPCEEYKDYIDLSTFNFVKKQEDKENHIKKCDKCNLYRKYVSSSKTAREKRNKNVLKVIEKNPYIQEETLTEEQYINQSDIMYFKKEFRNNPCETNFYYLVSAYIKNGDKKHAQKLLEEGFELYKNNVFMIKTNMYLKENN